MATVSYERGGDVGYITLDRPTVLNAMNDALYRAVADGPTSDTNTPVRGLS